MNNKLDEMIASGNGTVKRLMDAIDENPSGVMFDTGAELTFITRYINLLMNIVVSLDETYDKVLRFTEEVKDRQTIAIEGK